MRWIRLLTITLTALALVACPLPFQFTPEDANGVAASNDPANPSVTAAPQLLIREQTTGSTVDSTPSAITARRNIDIWFESETPGASIFYTTDGSRPIPGQGTTVGYDSDSPLEYVGDGAGATIKAIAIGPSMYPSQVTERVVSVDYPTAAAPVFNPAPGAYQSDQTVTLTSSTPGATIYYTTAAGTGGAPVPVPGQPGTQEYTGPITVSGAGTSTSISAIAVAPETKTSSVNSGVYSIGFAGNAEPPIFSLRDGFHAHTTMLAIATGSSGAAIYYTVTTNGSEPPDPVPGDDGTDLYTGPIQLVHGGSPDYRQRYRFKAIASGGDFLPSSITSAIYDVIPEVSVTQGDDDYPEWGVPRTLREAIMALGNPSGWWNQNAPVWADEADIVMITFDPAINGGNPYTIALADSNPDRGILIERSVVIVGSSGDSGHVTISAGNGFRPFSVGNPDNPDLFVQFQDVTIADGFARGGDGHTIPDNGSGGGGGAGVGGAIYVHHGAEVVLERVVMRDNTARGGNGGDSGALVVGNWGAAGGSGGAGLDFANANSFGGNGGSSGGFAVVGGPGGPGSWLSGGGGGGTARTEPGAGGDGGFGGGGGGGGARRLGGLGAPGGTGGSFGGNGGQSHSSGTAGGGGGAGLGGAVFVQDGILRVRDSEFRGNSARGGQAGTTFDPSPGAGHGQGQGGAIFIYQLGQYYDEGGNVFASNAATDGSGASSGEPTVYDP